MNRLRTFYARHHDAIKDAAVYVAAAFALVVVYSNRQMHDAAMQQRAHMEARR